MAVWLLLFVPKRARDQRLCWLLVVEAKRAPRGPAIGEKRDATVIGSRPAFVSQQELSGLDPAASGSRRESAASATGGSDPRCRRAWLRAVAEVRDRSPNIAIVRETELAAAVDACASLIRDRFHDDDHHGVAAMLLDDGTILTGTAPDAINPSVAVCHEVEPYCAAFRLGKRVLASVCLHREPGGRTVVLSPCGVCRERLAVHGPDVLVAVAGVDDPTVVVWKPLKVVLPDHWMTVFPDEIDAGWTT